MIKIFKHNCCRICCVKYNNRGLFVLVFFTTLLAYVELVEVISAVLVIFTTKKIKLLAFKGDKRYNGGSWG